MQVSFGKILTELSEVADLRLQWGQSARVTFENSPHRQTQDIILRGPEVKPGSSLASLHREVDCVDYPAAKDYLYTMDLVRYFARDRALGRVILTLLPPGGVVFPHRDEGPVPETCDRYHMPLQANPSCLTILEGEDNLEVYRMTPGSVWLVNVQRQHMAVNMGDDSWIKLIVDVAK